LPFFAFSLRKARSEQFSVPFFASFSVFGVSGRPYVFPFPLPFSFFSFFLSLHRQFRPRGNKESISFFSRRQSHGLRFHSWREVFFNAQSGLLPATPGHLLMKDVFLIQSSVVQEGPFSSALQFSFLFSFFFLPFSAPNDHD